MKKILTNTYQVFGRGTLLKMAIIFVVLFMVSFSYPHTYIPDIGSYTHGFFEKVVAWSGMNVLHIRQPYTVELVSDSTGMYILALLLVLIAMPLGILWEIGERKHRLN